MAPLPAPPYNPNAPIPNDPFNYPEGCYICGPYYPVLVNSTSGLSINTCGVISVTGGGGGGGVVAITGTPPIVIGGTTANPVLSISPATQTSAGSIELASNAEVQAGADTTRAITPAGLLSNVSSSVSTVSNICIASSSAVKCAYDLANAAIPKSLIVAKGAIISGSSAGNPVALAVGANGTVLSANSACSTGLEWIASGGSGTVTSVTAGTGLTGGTITTSGTIALANTSVAQGSYTYGSFTVDAQGRLTAASSGTSPITCTAFDAKGDILAGTGADAYAVLSAGSNGQVLTLDSSCSTGLKWATVTGSGTVTNIATGTGLTGGPITTTGTIALCNTGVTSGSYTYGAFTVDSQGRLTAASSGLAPVCCCSFTAKGQVLVGTGSCTFCVLGVGSDGQVLTADSTCDSGIKWASGGGGGVSDATPTTAGTVKGCTNNTACNVSLGCSALGSISTGNSNVAVGLSALGASTTGCFNVAIGACASAAGTASSYNVAAGYGSLAAASACCNVAVGAFSGYQATNVSNSVLLGSNAGYSASSAVDSVFIGNNAGFRSRGPCNILIGSNSGPGFPSPNLTGGCNVGLGAGSLAVAQSTATANTALGHQAGCALTTGECNTFVGVSAGKTTTTGRANVAIGCGVQLVSPTADCQLAIGFGPSGYWLRGDSSGSIEIGGGIIDCNNTKGGSGWLLASDGVNGVRWCDAVPLQAAPTSSTIPGNPGMIAVDSTYLYVNIGLVWCRVAWDTTPW